MDDLFNHVEFHSSTESDIDDFIEGVKDTLTSWLLIHTNAEIWANEWTMDDDIEYAYNADKGKIKNDYFEFDWQEAALKYDLSDIESEFVHCPECDQTYLYEDWQDHIDEYHDGTDIDSTDPDQDYIIEFMRDIDHIPSTYALEQSLIKEGFAVYSEALDGYICGIVEEINDLLNEYENAETKQDLWLIVLKMLGVWHVHGEIIADYGDRVGLDSDFAYNVRENSGAEMFGEDEFLEWIST